MWLLALLLVAAPPYRLPWQAGVDMYLTQDCSDACCDDHVEARAFAYDFATNAGAFTVTAARAGTITHLKISSTDGCDDAACIDDANVLVIDHGDGTQATYLHLAGDSLAPGIACGGQVKAGQPLAVAGSTGWSSDVHLHFQVTAVRPDVPHCECGADGRGCDAATVPWASFWSSKQRPTLPVTFESWRDAAACSERRITFERP